MNALNLRWPRPKKVWVVVDYSGGVPAMVPWTARETRHEAWEAHVTICCGEERPVSPQWQHLFEHLEKQRAEGQVRVEKAVLLVTR